MTHNMQMLFSRNGFRGVVTVKTTIELGYNKMAHSGNDNTSGDGRDGENDETIIIKKYANRRLYNTKSSQYVVLEDLAAMVRSGADFTVYDAKTGSDITRSVLTQIIFEEEGKGKSLLPLSFLRDMIRLYGDNINALVPDYLESSMKFFQRNREELQKTFEAATGAAALPLSGWREMAERNRFFIEKTAKMFNPFFLTSYQDSEKSDDIEKILVELAETRAKLREYEQQSRE